MKIRNLKRFPLLAPLLYVITLGVAIRLYFSYLLGYDWDASILVYQALLASKGAMMFSQIRIEEPFYVYLLALLVPILGVQLWIVKLLSGLASLVIAFLVFLISKELFGKRIGILASSLYLLIPVVAIFDVQGTYRTVFQIPVITSLFLVLRGISSKRKMLLIIAGVLTGISVFLYAGSLFYGLLLIAIPLIYEKSSFRKKAESLMVVVTGLASGFSLGMFLLLLSGSNYELIREGWIPSIITFAGGSNGVGSRVSSLSSFIDYLDYIARYIYVVTRNWFSVLGLGIIYTLSLVLFRVRMLNARKKLVICLIGLILATYFAISIIGIELPPHGEYGLFDVSSLFEVLFIAEIFGLIFLVFLMKRDFGFQFDRHHGIMLLWLACLIVFLGSFQIPHGFYFQFFAAPLCILSGYVVEEVWVRKQNLPKPRYLLGIGVLVFLVGSAISGAYMLASSNIIEWSLSSKQVASVASYLRSHTNSSDYVFSAVPIYAVAAGRQNAGNMDNYFYFVNKGTNDLNYSSTINEIYTLMQKGKVKYVILDPVGRTQAFLDEYPEIMTFFENNYFHATTIHSVSIWELKPD